MGSFLHAVGAFSARRRWLVVTVWVALIVAVGIAAAVFQKPAEDSFSIPGKQSVVTYERLTEEFPAQAGATGTVVIAAPEGETLATPEGQQAVADAVAALAQRDHVIAAQDPFLTGAVSPSGTIAYITVHYDVEQAELPDTVLEGAQQATESITDAGLRVEFAGAAYQEFHPPGGIGEVIGALIAMIVLYVTLRALVAAFLPFVTGIAAVALGVGGVYALTGFVSLPSTAPILALMLGLAVGIDYSLFILARHRAQLLAGMPMRDSIARANGTAGAAVVFAGATVMVALIALFMAGIPFLTAMGNAAAVTVGLAVLAALTLLPAVLSFAGLRVLPKKARASVAAGEFVSAEPRTNRWVGFVTRRRWLVLVTGVLLLGIMAIPAAQIRLGLPTEQSQPEDSSARQAYDLLAEGFGEGFNGPILLLAEVPDAADASGIAAVGEQVAQLDNVVIVTPPVPNEDGTAFVLTVIPATGPDSAETTQLVHDIRALELPTGVDVGVTGTAAITIDVSEGIGAALPGYLAVVIGLALLLLLVVFRSILIPIKALLGFLLTLAATTGAVVAVFQWGWFSDVLGVTYTGPIVAFLPIIAIGITFGLAMDYEVFLVSRMREEHLAGASDRDAITVGYAHSARVVAAAALIMASVFMGFLLDPDSIIKSMGFALAVAVLIDAFVVRMTLVPAAMALMGRAAWWLPGWLNRIVPHIHLEGDPEDDEPVAEPKELAPTP